MDTKPRKLPRQSRAKATVEAIVEATAQILVKEGYGKFTTAHVAARAGVSIGTLYQYFPNKNALAAAVVDRCCEDFLKSFERTLASQRHGTLAETIQAIVNDNLASPHLALDLHRIVNELAPRIGLADRTDGVSRATAGLIEQLLRDHSDEIEPDIDLAVAATIIETLLEALAHRVKLADPLIMSGEALAKEAARVIEGYLSNHQLKPA